MKKTLFYNIFVLLFCTFFMIFYIIFFPHIKGTKTSGIITSPSAV